MDKLECSICDEAFDGGSHRPRNLPCGHGFCTQCIEVCIRRGNSACSVCRKEHGANSTSELPVSFLLEDLLHKTATDERKKQTQILNVHKQNLAFQYIENNLNKLHQMNIDKLAKQKNKKEELEKETDILLAKINQEITERKKIHDEIKEAIQACQMKQTSFEIMELKLKAARSTEDIAKESEKATTEISKSKILEETLRQDFKISEELYAQVERDGILRSSKVYKEGGIIFIPNLSEDVEPPISSILIQEGELGLTSDSTTVFLDICDKYDKLLGRMFIRVFGN
ncbi:unnamed protein product [Meganyctiphanes norvegica]|uniref:RING-type domain-containing protein n=1 Tax=Meganyctiphanes norvegica TaxID=48144 RepID=A0AAV2QNZ0_MEGNR